MALAEWFRAQRETRRTPPTVYFAMAPEVLRGDQFRDGPEDRVEQATGNGYRRLSSRSRSESTARPRKTSRLDAQELARASFYRSDPLPRKDTVRTSCVPVREHVFEALWNAPYIDTCKSRRGESHG